MKVTKRRFNQLKKKLWKNPEVIDELFSNDRWLEHTNSDAPSKSQSEKMHQYILEHAFKIQGPEKLPYVSKHLTYQIFKYAAAAVIFTTISIGLWTYEWNTQPHALVKSEQRLHKKNIVVLPVVWELVTNTGSKIKKVHLPDLTVVDLYPQGTLKYEKGFSKPQRNIYLTGKSYFKVKRNPDRPFNVFAGGLKTTALGTSFTINTPAGRNRTSVILHTGKIVVSPELSTSRQKPVYLIKAESGLVYDIKSQVANLVAPKVTPFTKIPALETLINRDGNVLTLKNISLVEVIRLLGESYNVKIQSRRKEISNITYTGVVNLEKESLESVLQVIALINDMTVTKSADAYIIQKTNK